MPILTGAVCAGTDPVLWFADEGGPVESVEAAKAMCGKCPHRTPCLAWALAYESWGIWGGMTAAERKQLKVQT